MRRISHRVTSMTSPRSLVSPGSTACGPPTETDRCKHVLRHELDDVFLFGHQTDKGETPARVGCHVLWKGLREGSRAGVGILIRQGHACPRPAGAVDQPTGDCAPRPEPGHERARLRVSDGQRPGEPSAFMMDRQISNPMVGQAGDAKDAVCAAIATSIHGSDRSTPRR